MPVVMYLFVYMYVYIYNYIIYIYVYRERETEIRMNSNNNQSSQVNHHADIGLHLLHPQDQRVGVAIQGPFFARRQRHQFFKQKLPVSQIMIFLIDIEYIYEYTCIISIIYTVYIYIY